MSGKSGPKKKRTPNSRSFFSMPSSSGWSRRTFRSELFLAADLIQARSRPRRSNSGTKISIHFRSVLAMAAIIRNCLLRDRWPNTSERSITRSSLTRNSF